jgi:serine/threonine-protein kinase
LANLSLIKEEAFMLDFKDLEAKFSNITQIARGGQKVVYSATHPIYGGVVVKLFFKIDSRSEREIKIGTDFSFDCVPSVFETGQISYMGSNTIYLIEQRIDGEELRKRIMRSERFTLKEAINFLEQGLIFIKQLEAKKIIHRDIKPENIIISASGKVYFLDFGIARILGAPSLTKTDAIMGPNTPGYAAPEQFNNQKSIIDSRADLFSIGVVTYECLSGKNPFREAAASIFDILHNIETVTPVSFRIAGDTQHQFMGLLSSLMGKYPSRRPNYATQALNWLNAAKITLLF